MGYYGGYNNGLDLDIKGCLGKLFWVVLIIGVLYLIFANTISVDAAVQRFAEQAQVKESEIVVIRNSNNGIIFGDPRDVTFELKINDKPIQGRCTSGIFSQMVCRLYTGGD